jgi:hypothetical protein
MTPRVSTDLARTTINKPQEHEIRTPRSMELFAEGGRRMEKTRSWDKAAGSNG